MTTTVNAPITPGFSLTIQQGANPTIAATVYDRAGNPIDLTGYALKFSVKKTVLKSNGYGKLTPQDVVFLSVSATIVNATTGNITLPIGSALTGTPGSFAASLRIWNTTTTTRSPDDAYSGTFVVEPAVVR